MHSLTVPAFCAFFFLSSLSSPIGTRITLRTVFGPDLLWDVALSQSMVCVSSALCVLCNKAQVTFVTVSLIVSVLYWTFNKSGAFRGTCCERSTELSILLIFFNPASPKCIYFLTKIIYYSKSSVYSWWKC